MDTKQWLTETAHRPIYDQEIADIPRMACSLSHDLRVCCLRWSRGFMWARWSLVAMWSLAARVFFAGRMRDGNRF